MQIKLRTVSCFWDSNILTCFPIQIFVEAPYIQSMTENRCKVTEISLRASGVYFRFSPANQLHKEGADF